MDGSTSFIVATLLLVAGWVTLFRFLKHRKSRNFDRKYGRRAIILKVSLYLIMVMMTILYLRVFEI